MTRDDLIRELEYFRDLGFDSVHWDAAPAAPAVASTKAKEPVPDVVAPDASVPVSSSAMPKPKSPAAAAQPSPPPQTTPPARISMPLLSKTLPAPSMLDALGVKPGEDSLERISEDIGDCKRCRLCQGRNKIVFGSGNPQARLVFVGEGPGEDEDNSGLPFVGRAGQLLTKMIEGTAEREGIAIKRPDVYICNVVKCRPPNNRKPEPDEMQMCGQFLFRQLAVIQPKAICVLGATAAQALLNTREPMKNLRGNWAQWRDFPVMVTYHPSYLLRAYNAEAKREAWEDLKKVLHFVYDDPANLPG